MTVNIERREHGVVDPRKAATQHELDAAQYLVRNAATAAELGELLKSHESVLVRIAADARLGEKMNSGKIGYAELLEAEHNPVADVMEYEPCEWVYDGAMAAAVKPQPLGLSDRAFSNVFSALVLIAGRSPSEMRRRFVHFKVTEIHERDLTHNQKSFLDERNSLIRDWMLGDESNYNRYKLAYSVVDTPYRFSDALVDFAIQWFLHTGLTPDSYVDRSSWPKKIPGYFDNEERALVNPNWTGASAAGTGASRSAAADSGSNAASRSNAGTDDLTSAVKQAVREVVPHQPAAPGHVTIEHTKKSIKAQTVLAWITLAAGFVVLFVGGESRFVIGLGMMAFAVLWHLWLKLRKWWEHS